MCNYAALGPYEGPHKDIAKKVKTLDREAISLAAYQMAALIPKNAVLVPMPSHTGKPTFSAVLCKAVSFLTGLPIRFCLEGTPRESLCDLKNKEYVEGKAKGSLMPPADTLGFRKTADLPAGKKAFVIDNVIASGTTATAAALALGEETTVMVIACDRSYPKVPGMTDVTDTLRETRKYR